MPKTGITVPFACWRRGLFIWPQLKYRNYINPVQKKLLLAAAFRSAARSFILHFFRINGDAEYTRTSRFKIL